MVGSYDQAECEPFWAAAAALEMPLSLHTATRQHRTTASGVAAGAPRQEECERDGDQCRSDVGAALARQRRPFPAWAGKVIAEPDKERGG
jgi:hypothetical protein